LTQRIARAVGVGCGCLFARVHLALKGWGVGNGQHKFWWGCRPWGAGTWHCGTPGAWATPMRGQTQAPPGAWVMANL